MVVLFQTKNCMKNAILLLYSFMIMSSLNAQKTISAEKTVDLGRYKGTWYEIARLPNSFERKLKCASATYILRDDGKITVLNKGNYISDPAKSTTAKGVAWIPDKSSPGKLKVQFFWPFSGDYWIMYLDKNYRYVLVGDPSLKYLWILCREKKLDEPTYQMLLGKAEEVGYKVSSIIKVNQDCP
jgi:apolipoprotein D and lipocalin family protein